MALTIYRNSRAVSLTVTRFGQTGPPGPSGPAPSGTGLVSVTNGALDAPTTLAQRLAADAANLRTALGSPAGTGTSTGTNTGDQDLSGKQNVLVSGTNIKTVNGVSLLGMGNVSVGSPPVLMTDCGADPTGATDSTAAFGVAKIFAGASNGRIHFPAGSYKGDLGFTVAESTSRNWFITGDGGGSTGDWVASEVAGKTIIRPNNNANPVFKLEYPHGVFIRDLEIRGNGAGVSANGILIDHPSQNFAGNGIYLENVTIRAFTNGFNSVGGCNVIMRACGIFNNNIGIKIPNLPLAHSYRIEQCSLGGLATVLGGSGTSQIYQVEDGSFIDFLGCEMGNCTLMGTTASTGAPIINIIGGNMESITGTGSTSVLNLIRGGTFNMYGVRIATGNKTVCRADGTTANITGINIENNAAQGAMTLVEWNSFPYARVSGNGLTKTIAKYNSDFTVLEGSGPCEPLKLMARMTVSQTLAATGTRTVIFNQKDADVGAKYNTTTGEYTAGKQTWLRVSANMRLSGISTNCFLQVMVNGSNRKVLGQANVAGSVAMVNGSGYVSVNAGDIITIALNIGAGGLDVQAIDNWTSWVAIDEIPYFN